MKTSGFPVGNSRFSEICNICVIVKNLRIFDMKHYIKTVRPSSIVPEWNFSTDVRKQTKVRNIMSPKLLDAIVALSVILEKKGSCLGIIIIWPLYL